MAPVLAVAEATAVAMHCRALPEDGGKQITVDTLCNREEVFIMPGFDGTGPRGEGSMTGGGFGYCGPGATGYGRPMGGGFGQGRGLRRGYGPGFGGGRGYGRGLGRRSFQPSGEGWYGPAYESPYAMNPKEEVEMLRDEADALKNEIDAITGRIKGLESRASEPES